VSRAAAEVGSTANSYQILAKLAAGGMAEIFLARGEGVAGVERYCVLKRILRERASDVHFVRMFLDEARLAAQLQHPNIAQVYDIGKLGDSFFFTMEYVHGETVRALLHRAQGLRRKLPISCVLTIAAGTAAGLHHAHDRLGLDGRALGIVHRDVSPSNLMVSYEGGVKVVDFGVAKAADRAQETKSGTVKGKISYLSPEQCRGKRVDRRSDLFSLGICFWEMLTTERLFKRSSDFENMNAIVTEETPPPSARRPDVPPEIDQLVLRLLAKSPDDRFQTADELVEAVEAVSARTGSVLSASALGRFVRELFGQRPEPWLELESQQEQGEAVTVTSEPIPRELAIPAAEEVNHQLASVLDLSSPRSITASLDSLPNEVATTRFGKRATPGFPLEVPPPTTPGVLRRGKPDLRAPELASPAPAMVSDVVEDAPSAPVPLPPPPAALPPPPEPPVRTTGSAASAVPPSADAFPGSSGELLVPSSLVALVGPRSGPLVAPAGPRSGPLVAPAGPRSGPLVAPAGPQSGAITAPVPPVSRATPSGPFAAPSGLPAARVSASYRGVPPRRRLWPLFAVIGSAAVLGSIAVIVVMRSGAGPTVADAVSATPASEQPASSSITVSPITEPAPPDAAAQGSTEPSVAAGPGAIGEPSAIVEPASQPRTAVAVGSGSSDGARPATRRPAGTPPRGMRTPPPASAVRGTRAPGAGSAEPDAAGHAPTRADDELTRAYRERRFKAVVARGR